MRGDRLSNFLLAISVCVLTAALVYQRQQGEGQGSGEILGTGDTIPEYWRDVALTERTDAPVLVAFLTADCPWCRAAVPAWNTIATRLIARYPGARAMAVALSDSLATAAYIEHTGLALEVAYPAGLAAIMDRWKVERVPYTVLVGSSGRVAGAWLGVPDDWIDDIDRLLDLDSSEARMGQPSVSAHQGASGLNEREP